MNQYKLVMFQPTGCIAHVPIKLLDETRLDEHVALHLDAYRTVYNYDGPVHATVYQRKPNSVAQTIVTEEIYS